MRNRNFAASYERAVELMAAGCPLDYPDSLRPHSAAQRKPFQAKQLAGYAESRVYELGPFQTGYVIALRLWTDRPAGTIISEWSFVPPWQDHCVSWDYEPLDVIPEGQRDAYARVLDSRLMGVLKERRLLRRGYPIEGLLCGCSSQPIPEYSKGLVSAELTLSDDAGNTVALRIALRVVHRPAIPSKTLPARAGRGSGTMKSVPLTGR